MKVVAAPNIPMGKDFESLRELRNLTFLYKDNILLWYIEAKGIKLFYVVSYRYVGFWCPYSIYIKTVFYIYFFLLLINKRKTTQKR
jgi:hypothetical protein